LRTKRKKKQKKRQTKKKRRKFLDIFPFFLAAITLASSSEKKDSWCAFDCLIERILALIMFLSFFFIYIWGIIKCLKDKKKNTSLNTWEKKIFLLFIFISFSLETVYLVIYHQIIIFQPI
jgi:hypothetical protein